MIPIDIDDQSFPGFETPAERWMAWVNPCNLSGDGEAKRKLATYAAEKADSVLMAA